MPKDSVPWSNLSLPEFLSAAPTYLSFFLIQ